MQDSSQPRTQRETTTDRCAEGAYQFASAGRIATTVRLKCGIGYRFPLHPARTLNAEHVSAEWVKRPYLPEEDEDGVLYLWCKSYARSRYGTAVGAHMRHTPEERAYWAREAPVVERMLALATVEVVCDPERPVRSEAGPAVIWAFAATTGDTVHYVCVKRTIAPLLGAEIVRDLLGDRLDRACPFTYDPTEMRTGACGVKLPRDWYPDPSWFGRNIIPARPVASEKGSVRP